MLVNLQFRKGSFWGEISSYWRCPISVRLLSLFQLVCMLFQLQEELIQLLFFHYLSVPNRGDVFSEKKSCCRPCIVEDNSSYQSSQKNEDASLQKQHIAEQKCIGSILPVREYTLQNGSKIIQINEF